jgi:carbohydrate kinase (thermoresistant glucokinase family)
MRKESKVIILMGVSGSGKTTLGRRLAEALKAPFYDADDFHSPENKAKMRRGIPLTDENRLPWLKTLAEEIQKWDKENFLTILACSALKQNYRDLLSKKGNIAWIYLKGDPELIRKRLGDRKGHFADESLLESQLASLEEPSNAIIVDIDGDSDKIVKSLIQKLKGA